MTEDEKKQLDNATSQIRLLQDAISLIGSNLAMLQTDIENFLWRYGKTL